MLLAVTLTGCASADAAGPNPSDLPVATIDPALIPVAAPEDAVSVDPILFDTGFGEFTFKAGNGPAWCTINEEQAFAICEIDEAEANYAPIETPETCEYSYGYQFRLHGTMVNDGPMVDLPCSGGAYADPGDSNVLADGEKIQISGITCWVDTTNVRCDNEFGNYIALGADIWATK